MKVILNNKIELTPILVTGSSRFIQDSNRDVLSFIFPATEDMTVLDATFSATNCESIIIVGDDGAEAIHKGYTIRAELSKAPVEVTPATTDSDAIYEDRITVSMAQRTYMENQLASLTDTVDGLVVESLMN